MKKINDFKGITLIALIITIVILVILVILVTVAITLSLSKEGLFSRAKQAKEDYQIAANEEELEIAKIDNSMSEYITSDREEKYQEIFPLTEIKKDVTYRLTDSIKNYKRIEGYMLIEFPDNYQEWLVCVYH